MPCFRECNHPQQGFLLFWQNCHAAQDGIDHFTFEDKRMVIERLDVRGYVERGETTKDYRITITGFFPPTEVSSEHDAALYGFDDEGIGYVIEDNTSRFCGLRPAGHQAAFSSGF
jgi:hypothetical protein